jgi:hypothetical protein
MDIVKLTHSTNKLINFSKEQNNIIIEQEKSEEKNYNNNNNDNSQNKMIENSKTNRGQTTIRKSIEFNRAKMPEELIKKVTKPIQFKNLKIKPNNKISLSKGNINENNSNSNFNASSTMKTNENI